MFIGVRGKLGRSGILFYITDTGKKLRSRYKINAFHTGYGFRPKQDCHKAIEAMDDIIITKKINYLVDADIKGFFDNVNHEWLIKFLEHDIEDKNFIRYPRRIIHSGTPNRNPSSTLVSPIFPSPTYSSAG